MTWHSPLLTSLLKCLKRLPDDAVPALYPVVLTLASLAIAESYEFTAPGFLNRLVQCPSSMIKGIWHGAIALNHHIGDLIPQCWLDSFPHGDGAQYEEDVRAIAQAFADGSPDRSLDAGWLGVVHECLMSDTPADHPSSRHDREYHDFGQGIPGRKSQGAYYTPPDVVAYMVEQTVEPALNDGSTPPRILDPACGGGIFLLGAYRYILKTWEGEQGRSLSLAERTKIFQHSIAGVDLDSNAVFVTRLSLHLELLRGTQNTGDLTPNSSLPIPKILAAAIQQGNAIIDEGESGLRWEQAFPAVMTAGGFDVVLGNPPYLDSERMTAWMPHWRHYCTQHYSAAQGNWDLFCVFIEKALTLCKPGGYHSFIVPNKIASAPYATVVRSLLATHTNLLAIRDYSQASVFAASVYPLVYVVQRRFPEGKAAPTPPHHPERSCLPITTPSLIRYECIRADGTQTLTAWLPQTQFSTPKTGWVMNTNRDATATLLHLCHAFPPLEELAQVHGAATVAEAYILQPLIHNDWKGGQVTSTPCRDSPPTHHQDGMPPFQFLNSGTIDRYCSLWGIKPLRYLGCTYETPVVDRHDVHTTLPRRYEQAIAPKLVVAGMTKRLECVVDVNGTVLAGKSTSIILSHDLPLLYLLGILNSELIHRIFLLRYGSNSLQGGYLRIGPPQLRSLPIAQPMGELGDRLIHQVTQMLELQRRAIASPHSQERESLQHQIQTTDHAIDQTVYALYQLAPDDIQVLTPSRRLPDTPAVF